MDSCGAYSSNYYKLTQGIFFISGVTVVMFQETTSDRLIDNDSDHQLQPWSTTFHSLLCSSQYLKASLIITLMKLVGVMCLTSVLEPCWHEQGWKCLIVLTSHWLLLRFLSTTEELQLSFSSLTDYLTVTYLEDLREEAWTNLLTEEVINAGQAGHGAPQGSVRGRADPVGCMNAVERRLVWAAVPLLRITETALGVVVHGAGGPPRSSCSVLSQRGTTMSVRLQESWGTRW